MSDAGRIPSEAERGQAVLSLGILAFRWVSLAWMVVLALTAGELRRPALAWATIAALAAWTGWLTVARPRPAWPVLAADLALAAAVNLVAGLVMPAATVGERPWFAAGYPVVATDDVHGINPPAIQDELRHRLALLAALRLPLTKETYPTSEE